MAGPLWPLSSLHSAPPPPPTKVPTIDAEGILNLQAGAGLLTEHRGHAQHIFKGEHVVMREYPADAISERVDLWWGGGDEVCQGRDVVSMSLSHLPLAPCPGLELKRARS